MKFDDDKPPQKPREAKFSDSLDIITDYDDSFCELVIKHGRQGLFIEQFSGKHNICFKMINSWLSDTDTYSKFDSAVKISISACLHFWMTRLMDAINNGDWDAVPVLSQIVNNLTKSIPKELRSNLLNDLTPETSEQKALKARLQSHAQFSADIGGVKED